MPDSDLIAALDYLSMPENLKVPRKYFIEHFGEQTHQQLKTAKYIKTSTMGDPFGVWENAVTITELGSQFLLAARQSHKDLAKQRAEDAAKDAAKEAKAERLRVKDTRRSWWQFFLGLLIGWILGGFTPQEVWHAIGSFLGMVHP